MLPRWLIALVLVLGPGSIDHFVHDTAEFAQAVRAQTVRFAQGSGVPAQVVKFVLRAAGWKDGQNR